MNIAQRFFISLVVMMTVMVSGCIDDKYDLSDIDTTTELKVENLILPINIDSLRLGNIIKLKEDGKIKIIDGKYAVLVEGDFESDKIKVNDLKVNSPQIPDNRLPLIGQSSGGGVTYAMPRHKIDFDYRAGSVDAAIRSIEEIGVHPMRIGFSFSFPELQKLPDQVKINNLKIKFPAGIIGTGSEGTYNSETGILTIPEATCALKQTGEISFYVNTSAIKFTAENSQLNNQSREFFYHSDLEIESGNLVFAGAETMPQMISMKVHYIFDEIRPITFTGDIDYSVTDLEISPVELDNLPGFLSQEGTNILLANPQIYLSLYNPLGDYGLDATFGLSLKAERNQPGASNVTALVDNIRVGARSGIGPYAFCLSPYIPQAYFPGYDNVEYVNFKDLGSILSGSGLPARIYIAAINPGYKMQHVNKFRLGEDLMPLKGRYTFFAPLNLDEGSSIVYSDSSKDWSSDALSDLTIESLDVTLDITTDINAAVRLTGYPIDADGNRINNVEVIGADIPANASDYTVTIRTTGAITNLDGFVYTVYATSGNGEVPLEPNQCITLKNIKAKVSGKYIKKL